MIRHKSVLLLSVLFFLITGCLSAYAQVEEETESQESGALGGFLKILGDAAKDALEEEVQEEIDDWAGTYKGRIGEVMLLERRGNAITFRVSYKDVKRSDGVQVTGEVLQWGEVKEGFSTTLTPIREKSGSVIMTIGYQSQGDSDWGLAAEDITTDQVRLSLVRETNPEKPFGILVYDFQKTWTDNSEVETIQEESAEAVEEEEEGAIELAEGEETEAEQSGSAGSSAGRPSITLAKPGTIIIPNKNATANNTALATGAKPSLSTTPTAQADASGTKTMTAMGKISATALIPTVSEYNFYDKAGSAKWKNASADLKYPGTANDSAGFVKSIENGVICPGNNAKRLLETHPQWIDGGSIQGMYPLMILGDNVKFKAVGAMLKGAEGSDGVIMSVSVLKDKRLKRVVRKRISTKNYTNMEADLSEWAGQTVQIVLSVTAGNASTKDWAVWVNPRLTNK